MFDRLFQSATRPFRATPDIAFYYPFEAAASVRQTVVRALQRAEGPTIVLGGAGLGKSLLADLVTADMSDRFDIVRLSSTRLCSRRALLQNILFELALPYRNLSEGELRLSILDRLEPGDGRAPDGVLLIVDEADALPVKLLEELRLINNFTRHGQPRTRLALFGSLRLEDTFAEPALESFSQRLAARCYLQPMNKRDTAEFVRHQLRVAGADPSQVITHEGLECVYAASEGVPRLANQIMDHALMLAIANCQNPISAALIEEAWADLQQLPAPWHAGHEGLNKAQASVGSSVEFGSLNDDGEWGEEDAPIAQEELAQEELAEPYEETLADQVFDAPTNFFAAFRDLPIEDETDHGLAQPAEEGVAEEGNIDEEVEQDNAPEPLITPPAIRVAPVSTAETYFADRPTDMELLAFEDEQSQYDTLGMWENDPPLLPLANAHATTAGSASDDEAAAFGPVAEPAIDAGRQQDELTKLFGADFDEEIQVPKQTSKASRQIPDDFEFAPVVTATNDRSIFYDHPVTVVEALDGDLQANLDGEAELPTEPPPADGDTLELSAAEVNDYVYRLQEYADCVVQSQLDAAIGEEMIVAQESTVDGVSDAWQVSTAEGDEQHALNLARDIEDLVSQLNFSAFSVEPYSVEQIAIQAKRNRTRVEDSIRTGDNDEVFMLHRPQELESRTVFDPSADEYDDDRNLLVIEEDIPAAARPSDMTQVEKPTVKISPYSQLFARLRK